MQTPTNLSPSKTVRLTATTVAVILTLNSCASIERSALFGGGVGIAVGTGIGIVVEKSVGSALIGAAIGGVLGGALGYLEHKEPDAPPATKSEEATAPSLLAPEIRRVWVPDRIEGQRFIKGHYFYEIQKQPVWSK